MNTRKINVQTPGDNSKSHIPVDSIDPGKQQPRPTKSDRHSEDPVQAQPNVSLPVEIFRDAVHNAFQLHSAELKNSGLADLERLINTKNEGQVENWEQLSPQILAQLTDTLIKFILENIEKQFTGKTLIKVREVAEKWLSNSMDGRESATSSIFAEIDQSFTDTVYEIVQDYFRIAIHQTQRDSANRPNPTASSSGASIYQEPTPESANIAQLSESYRLGTRIDQVAIEHHFKHPSDVISERTQTVGFATSENNINHVQPKTRRMPSPNGKEGKLGALASDAFTHKIAVNPGGIPTDTASNTINSKNTVQNNIDVIHTPVHPSSANASPPGETAEDTVTKFTLDSNGTKDPVGATVTAVQAQPPPISDASGDTVTENNRGTDVARSTVAGTGEDDAFVTTSSTTRTAENATSTTNVVKVDSNSGLSNAPADVETTLSNAVDIGDILGVWAGGSLQSFLDFEKFLGIEIKYAHKKIGQKSWTHAIEHSLRIANEFAPISERVTLSIIFDLLPKDGSTAFADVINGSHDTDLQRIAANLIAGGLGDSIIRLMHEADMPGRAWSFRNGNASDFIDTWRHVHEVMMRVPGADFKWQYSLNGPAGSQGKENGIFLTELGYPGDDYVDSVSVGNYDRDRFLEDFEAVREKLDFILDFAVSHHKKLDIAEWGLWSATDNGGGDNPPFIEKTLEWFHAIPDEQKGYLLYFNNHPKAKLSQFPNSEATFRDLFGPDSIWEYTDNLTSLERNDIIVTVENSIEGGRDGDVMVGTTGNDALYGYTGDDTFKGNDGADIVVFNVSVNEGTDQIVDFSTTEGDLLSFTMQQDVYSADSVDIEDLVSSFADGAGRGKIDTLVLQSGTTILITDTDDTLATLEDIETNSLINPVV